MGRQRKFNETEKWCNRCEAMLPHAAFRPNATTASRLQDYCIPCHGYFNSLIAKRVAEARRAREALLAEALTYPSGSLLERDALTRYAEALRASQKDNQS